LSIYATQWEIALPVWVQGFAPDAKRLLVGTDQDGQAVYERFIKVRVQVVPAHIGHEGGDDLYVSFLPPLVEYDENDWEREWTPRAVFIVDEDHLEKDGQRYVAPLLRMNGNEYESAGFDELLGRIRDALEERFGGDTQFISVRPHVM
jgi:hypothetical protein